MTVVLFLSCLFVVCASKDDNKKTILEKEDNKTVLKKDKYYHGYGFIPKEFVRDKETAIKIAIAIMEPIFGSHQFKNYLPLKAELKDTLWEISRKPPFGVNVKGGILRILIDKKSGAIIDIVLGK